MPDYLVIKEYGDGECYEYETWEADSVKEVEEGLRDELMGDFESRTIEGVRDDHDSEIVIPILHYDEESELTGMRIVTMHQEIDVEPWREEIEQHGQAMLNREQAEADLQDLEDERGRAKEKLSSAQRAYEAGQKRRGKKAA